ncbi:hypothetical protein H9M94_01090 [Mycoplasma sp. Pen4]|uniref:hypothetical protein n=1 Tax=Mycoplasma sp. Pen4 TaxID=640330 RepID=UPI0016544B19|nr:hypothetical protein [Mycoplasma sp. Pen4]QNM93758.1 hypothetical protein H9M94_00575 [Mycoplasma sp. Pen4]QNM93854.1 hypothetical protein H9M94_01090 [Mycoplasma sp. Pen4]
MNNINEKLNPKFIIEELTSFMEKLKNADVDLIIEALKQTQLTNDVVPNLKKIFKNFEQEEAKETAREAFINVLKNKELTNNDINEILEATNVFNISDTYEKFTYLSEPKNGGWYGAEFILCETLKEVIDDDFARNGIKSEYVNLAYRLKNELTELIEDAHYIMLNDVDCKTLEGIEPTALSDDDVNDYFREVANWNVEYFLEKWTKKQTSSSTSKM